jgi:uncharacterized membrane protein YfcA
MNWILSAAAGFFAELVDSGLGMAYGVTASTILQAAGFAPAVTSATVHTAETLLTAVNGLSHFMLGNVDRKLFFKLVGTGTLAAVIGAYLLSELEAPWLAPAIQCYLLASGVIVLLRAFGLKLFPRVNPALLGAVGGLADAVGGGGWGPIVTGTLIASGDNPRTVIGSVNAAEFFVTISQSIVFLTALRASYIGYLTPFAIGGLVAAPLGAWICKTLDKKAQRKLYILVGLLLILTNTAKLLTELYKSI